MGEVVALANTIAPVVSVVSGVASIIGAFNEPDVPKSPALPAPSMDKPPLSVDEKRLTRAKQKRYMANKAQKGGGRRASIGLGATPSAAAPTGTLGGGVVSDYRNVGP